MQGRPLIKIEHDLKILINTLLEKDYIPILTTLAPLANYSHEASLKQTLERFNEFIKRHSQLQVIDICPLLVNERGQILFGCFQQ